MKHILTGLLLTSLSFAGHAQQEISKMEYTVPVTSPKQASHIGYLSDSLKKEPLFYTKHAEVADGHVKIYQRFSNPGLVTIPIAPAGSEGTQLLPAVGILTFVPKERKFNYTTEYIHLYDLWQKGPLDYTVAQLKPVRLELGSNTTQKRLKELTQRYPSAFRPVSRGQDSFTQKTAVEKNESGYVLTESEKVIVSYPSNNAAPVLKSRDTSYTVNTSAVFEKLQGHNSFVYNPLRDTWTSLRGENREGTENKQSEFRNYHFITTDSKGNLQHDVALNFEFNRSLALARFVQDVQNPGEGKTVYIFERHSSLFANAKFIDPAKNNYELVVLNSDGTRAYSYTFQAGAPETNSFVPLHAYSQDDKVCIVGRINDGLMMLIADKIGVEITQRGIDEHAGAFPRIDSRWEFAGSKVIDNQLYFWGERSKLIQAASNNPQTEMKLPEIIHFVTFLVVQIDLKTNSVVRQYSFDRKEGDLQIKTHVEDVFAINNKIIFYTSYTKRKREAREYEGSNRLNFYTNEQFYNSGLDVGIITRPILYIVDPGNTSVNTYRVSDGGFANLYPRRSWLSDANTLYLLGAEDSRKQDELTYKLITIGF